MTQDRDMALARLDDYVRGCELDGREAYEDELFERALSCAAPELGFREELGSALRVMATRGTLNLWLTASEAERMTTESGLRVLRLDFDPARPGMPDLSADFDLLITRVPIDLRGVRRVDAEVLGLDGRRLKLMPEVKFDPADGAVFACCESELARAAAAAKTVTRVWGYDDSGKRLLGEIHSG